MDYQCCEQLTQMRLNGMRAMYQRQEELPAVADLSFDERFRSIVQAQFDIRNDRRIARGLKAACLREPSASLENIDYDGDRRSQRPLIAQLSDMHWVREGKGIIITGSTGTGKTFLLCAFGHAACVMGYSVKYYRVPRLIESMAQARSSGGYEKMIKELEKPDILILDDFGLNQCDHLFSLDLLEIMDERDCRKKSVLIGSQLPVRMWPDVLVNKTAADGFMDRVVNKAYRIALKGRSRRASAPLNATEDNIEGNAPVEGFESSV